MEVTLKSRGSRSVPHGSLEFRVGFVTSSDKAPSKTLRLAPESLNVTSHVSNYRAVLRVQSTGLPRLQGFFPSAMLL